MSPEFSRLAFEEEADADRASRGRGSRSAAYALKDPMHEREFDLALQALVAKQVP
jgi:hypothetical protein